MQWITSAAITMNEGVPSMKKVALFLVGFFIVANLYVLPWMSDSPRMTDVIGILAYVWLFFYIFRVGISPLVAVFSLLYLTPFTAWAAYSYIVGDTVTFVAGIRWLLALPIAIFIVNSRKIFNKHNPVYYGIWYGCIVNVAVMLLQSLNLHDLVQSFGLAPTDGAVVWVYKNYRSSGMYSHPNGSMAVLSLIVPVSIHLFLASKRNKIYLALGIIVVFIGGALTYTRSAILVSLILIAIVMLLVVRNKLLHAIRWSPVIFAILVLILLIGPPGGWERWTDMNNYSSNSSERMLSTVKSLEVMIDHPLGLGVIGSKEKVREYSGIGATHNAFMLLGGSFGVLPGIFTFFAFAFVIIQMFYSKQPTFVGLLCTHVFMLYFFEELVNNPVFITISMWFLIHLMVQIEESRFVLHKYKPAELYVPRNG